MSVVPATQEAEAGESLELGGRGCSEPRYHGIALQPGDRMRLCLEKEKEKRKEGRKGKTEGEKEGGGEGG